ncbi:MAG: ComF family protein, partial [Deltaproteobacteria bacterium]
EEVVRGKRVLVVDDVFTTGATISEISRVLLKAKAKEVFAVTLARSL